MAEQQNSNFAPPASKQMDSDLYSQIAAGDQEEETKKTRAKSSFVMNFMISYMRLTLFIDAKRRQYQKLFRILGGIWAVLMMLLYILGFIMLLILIVSYMRFPTEIRDYLKANNVICEDMKIPGYIISQVELKGLHDKDDTYRIDSLSISSTFADFLNRRARNVSAKGVRLTLDPNAKANNNPFLLLSKLSKGDAGQAGLRIDSLKIENAVVTVKGKDYTLPISLSLTGIYGSDTNISSYITIDQPSLKVDGPLAIRNDKGGLLWDLNIASGQIAFPGRPLQKMTGKVSFKTNQTELRSVSVDLSVFINQARRDIKLNLDKKKDQFSGLFSLKWLDAVNTAKPVEQTKLDFNLSGVKLTADGGVQTQSPIQVSLTSTYSPNLKVTALTGSLTGKLSCQLFDTCSYQLDKPATLSTKKISIREQGYEVNNATRFQFMLEPSPKFADISFKTGQINFDLNTKNFVFNGEQRETKNEVIFRTTKGQFAGHFNLWDKNIMAALSLDGFTYQSPSIDLKKGRLVADDIFDDNAKFYLTAPDVSLKNNTQIKVPFALTYARDKGVSNVALLLENKRVQILFGGSFDWLSGYTNGQLVIPSIDLGSLRQPLYRISDLVPEEFIKTSGKVAAYGRVSGNLYSDLKGPLYLSLTDFGFETEKLKIKGVNTALTAESVVPFVTEPDQKIYIKNIDSFIPITNVDMTVKAEDNYAQLKNLSADVAGISLQAGETVVPYKNIGTLIYLRSQREDLTDAVKDINLKNWKNIGAVRGNILFPIEVKDMSLSIKNAILQLFGAELQYTGPNKGKPAFLGKNTKLSIGSGTVTVDSSDNKEDGNKISVLLDTVLLPSKLKKTIRESFTGQLSDILTFKAVSPRQIPAELLSRIRHVQNQANKFRVK